jgi:hypothetical protein
MRVLYADLAEIGHLLRHSMILQAAMRCAPNPRRPMYVDPFFSSSLTDDAASNAVEACEFGSTCRDSSRIEAIFSNTSWPGRDALQPRFRCNRRQSPRWTVPGHATILALGTELGNLIELTRLDGSPWWLAGDASESMPAGTRVSVGFSEPDGRPACGFVERCEGFGEGRFRIAIRFDGALVA